MFFVIICLLFDFFIGVVVGENVISFILLVVGGGDRWGVVNFLVLFF